ncbi:MAG: type II toxin-antitoxin system ParD family antitoxin [Paracoccus sp. (in: a-proteobacteria)]|nr:type II toxin-antitoxin system ParD family antitoxin [Paracoccus sp. (in: a-proteobacteria)]
MPDIQLTEPMQDRIRRQIAQGAYADPSDVVRAGLRLLMEQDGARQFYALKAELDRAAADTGAAPDFAPRAYEPDAFHA